jgi:hypothetical protein
VEALADCLSTLPLINKGRTLTQIGDGQRRSFPLAVGVVDIALGGEVVASGGWGGHAGRDCSRRQGRGGVGSLPPWPDGVFVGRGVGDDGRSATRAWSGAGATRRKRGR